MGLGEEGPKPPEYKRFSLRCRTICRFQLRGYKFCVEAGKSVGQGKWQHLKTDSQRCLPKKKKNSVSSIHTSEYIKFVNPGCKLFVESQLKPL